METYLLDFQKLLIIIHPSSAKALEERLESGIEKRYRSLNKWILMFLPAEFFMQNYSGSFSDGYSCRVAELKKEFIFAP